MNDSISKIASAFESARDLTLEAAVAASSRLGTKGMYENNIKTTELRDLLDNKGDRSLKKAMKYLTYQFSLDAANTAKSVLPDVLKNINCSDFKTRRMVYIYLLRFAELDPNTSLLAINSIQQTLLDKNPEQRALALDVLSSLNIPSIYPLVLHSAKEMKKDSSFKVRYMVGKAFSRLNAANAVTEADLITLVKTLFEDSDFRVVSSAVPLFKKMVISNNGILENFHCYYRRFVKSLHLFESNCFKDLIDILILYAKTFLSSESNDFVSLIENLNGPVLNSFDVSSLLACTKAMYELCPTSKEFQNSETIVALLKGYSFAATEIKEILIQTILYLEIKFPGLFIKSYKRFILFPNIDSEKLMILKIQLLTKFCNNDTCQDIIQHLANCATDSVFSVSVRRHAILSLTSCSDVSDISSKIVMKWLLKVFKESRIYDPEISNSVVNLLRCLVFRHPEENIHTVWSLSKLLSEEQSQKNNFTLSSETQAGIIWLVGEFVKYKFEIAAHVLKEMIPKFSFQETSVRLQILTLSAKVISQYMESTDNENRDSVYFKMFDTVLKLAQYDDNYDIRDRSRTYNGLIKECGIQISSLILQAPKLTPTGCDPIYFVDKEIQLYFLQKNLGDIKVIVDDSLRDNEAPIKDYTKAKMGISSSDYFKQEERSSNYPNVRKSSQKADGIAANEGSYAVSNKDTYKLKSLDEFFAETPDKKKFKRKVIIEEESSDDEEESSDVDSAVDENEESDSEEETESDDSDTEGSADERQNEEGTPNDETYHA